MRRPNSRPVGTQRARLRNRRYRSSRRKRGFRRRDEGGQRGVDQTDDGGLLIWRISIQRHPLLDRVQPAVDAHSSRSDSNGESDEDVARPPPLMRYHATGSSSQTPLDDRELDNLLEQVKLMIAQVQVVLRSRAA